MFLTGIIVFSLAFPALSTSIYHTHNTSFVPDHTLRITYNQTSVACRSKVIGLVNGTSPGPVIHLRENVTSWIRVYNDVPGQNLTMHWHGLSQSTAPFSDGTPQASQWPIPAHHFFDYEIKPRIGEAGTYFYHSHVGFQASAVAGPLIVLEAEGRDTPYKYDDERTLFISEFYNQTDQINAEGLVQTPLQWPGDSEAVLVNGKSYAATDGQKTGMTLPFSPYIPTRDCGPEVIEVEPNTTYRFRTIGGTAIALVAYNFEEHNDITIIAADGMYTKPATTDRIQVGPGQRFDYLLHTKTRDELATLNRTWFWIHLETRYRPVNVTSYAILKYKMDQNMDNDHGSAFPPSPPSVPPTAIPEKGIQTWLEYQLQSLNPTDFPAADQVTRTVYINSDQLVTKLGRVHWTANNHTWTETEENINATLYTAAQDPPYLVEIYQKGSAAIPNYNISVSQYGGLDPSLNVYAARVGEIVDIVLINEPNGLSGGFDNHPWHIHGGHVWDLGSGPGAYNATSNEAKLRRKFGPGQEPAMRDVTMLYKYEDDDGIGTLAPYSAQGWRAWRLRVEDAGVWMVHCHILHHMILGMQTVWVMGTAEQIVEAGMGEPYVAGYLQFGGSAYGNATYDPIVRHHFG